MERPSNRKGGSTVFLAYSGIHYMLLKPAGVEGETTSGGSESGNTFSVKRRRAPSFRNAGPEEYHPGVSVFKGRRMEVWLIITLFLV